MEETDGAEDRNQEAAQEKPGKDMLDRRRQESLAHEVVKTLPMEARKEILDDEL